MASVYILPHQLCESQLFQHYLIPSNDHTTNQSIDLVSWRHPEKIPDHLILLLLPLPLQKRSLIAILFFYVSSSFINL